MLFPPLYPNIYQAGVYQNLYPKEKENFLGKITKSETGKLGYYLGAAAQTPYLLETIDQGDEKKGAFYFLSDKKDAQQFFYERGAVFKGYKNYKEKKNKYLEMIDKPTYDSIGASFPRDDITALVGVNPKTKDEVILSYKDEVEGILTWPVTTKTGEKEVQYFSKKLIFGEEEEEEDSWVEN